MIKFIKYTGKYPCLCLGTLVLEVDGKTYKFGHTEEYSSFWSSGGNCGFYDHINWETYINKGPWEIDQENLPEELKEYSKEISNLINDNVEFGCCGGCL